MDWRFRSADRLAATSQRLGAGAHPVVGDVTRSHTLLPTLALELTPTRVNAIAPGFIDTPLLDAAAVLFGAPDRSALIAAATAGLPVPRAGGAEELAEAVLFLVRHEYVTGETLRVDGGARWR